MTDAGRGPPLLTESSGLTLLLGSRDHARMRERFFRQTYILSSWQNPHSARGVAGLKRPPVVPLAPGRTDFPECPGLVPGSRPARVRRAPPTCAERPLCGGPRREFTGCGAWI